MRFLIDITLALVERGDMGNPRPFLRGRGQPVKFIACATANISEPFLMAHHFFSGPLARFFGKTTTCFLSCHWITSMGGCH